MTTERDDKIPGDAVWVTSVVDEEATRYGGIFGGVYYPLLTAEEFKRLWKEEHGEGEWRVRFELYATPKKETE